jgi:hypothetical protein
LMSFGAALGLYSCAYIKYLHHGERWAILEVWL